MGPAPAGHPDGTPVSGAAAAQIHRSRDVRPGLGSQPAAEARGRQRADRHPHALHGREHRPRLRALAAAADSGYRDCPLRRRRSQPDASSVAEAARPARRGSPVGRVRPPQ